MLRRIKKMNVKYKRIQKLVHQRSFHPMSMAEPSFGLNSVDTNCSLNKEMKTKKEKEKENLTIIFSLIILKRFFFVIVLNRFLLIIAKFIITFYQMCTCGSLRQTRERFNQEIKTTKKWL